MRRRFFIQRFFLVGSYILLGIIIVGSFLDAIANALALIPPLVTSMGAILILSFWLAAEILLRRQGVDFRVQAGREIRATKLGIKIRGAIIGALALVCFPRLFDWDNNTNDDLRKEISRLRSELEQKRDVETKLLEAVTILISQKNSLWEGIPLTSKGLEDFAKKLDNLEKEAAIFSELAKRKGSSENRSINYAAAIGKVEDSVKRIKNNLGIARQLVNTRDPTVIAKAFPSGAKEAAVSSITTPEATTVYRKGEQQEFLRDASGALKDGVPRRLVFGTPTVALNCLGAQEFVCANLELDTPGGSWAKLEWHLKGSQQTDQRLALHSRKNLSQSLRIFAGSLCAWYIVIGQRSYGDLPDLSKSFFLDPRRSLFGIRRVAGQIQFRGDPAL